MTKNQSSVKVALVAMDTRSEQSLRLVFENRSGGKISVTTPQDAHVVVLDLDSQAAESSATELKKLRPNIPIIAISNGDNSASYIHKSIAKPISVSELLNAVVEVSQMKSVEDEKIKKVSDEKIRRAFDALNVKKTAESMGDKIATSATIPVRKGLSKLSDEMYFDPERFLLGKVIDAWKNAKQNQEIVLIKCWKDKILLLEGEKDIIHSNLNSNQIRALAIAPLDDDLSSPVEIHSLSVKDSEYKKYVNDKSIVAQDAEVFLWNLGLMTSRGRLPRGADIEQRVYLRRWPNLTRIVSSDHILKILAYWIRQPVSAVDLATALKINMEDVFAIYSAANACGLAGIARRKVDDLYEAQSLETSEKRSLLASILGHLRPRQRTEEKFA